MRTCRTDGSVPRLLLMVVLVCTLVGSGSLALAQAKAPKGTLTVVQPLLPVVIDPHVEYLTSSWNISYSIFDPLTLVDGNMKVQPRLAVSWKQIDPLTWRFNLRQGVSFHNGEAFDSSDVVFSFNRILDPATKTIWTGIYAMVDSIRAIDKYTVEIKTKYPYAALAVDFGRMVVLPKDTYEKLGKEKFFKHPIGTGPFKFVESVPGERIVLQANTDYWEGAPGIRTVIWKGIPDEATRVAELLAGEADLAAAITPSSVPLMTGRKDINVSTVESVRLVQLWMNTLKPPFDDLRVRQAVSHAINVDEIVQHVMEGRAYPATGYFSRYTFGKNPDLKRPTYDLNRAKKLLAEAGYPNGFSTVISFGRGRFPKDEEIVLAITDNLKKVGIHARVEALEWGVFSARRAAGEMEGLWVLSAGNTTGDPDQLLRELDLNRSAIYYKDPELTALIVKQASATDLEERERLAGQVEMEIDRRRPVFTLFALQDIYAYSTRLQDWVPRPNELIWLRDARLSDR